MLCEMPDFEIFMIHSFYNNKKLINTLTQWPFFETETELFKVLDFGVSDAADRSEPYEYLRKVKYPYYHDMS